MRDVRLGLVVVIIRHKKLDGVVGKKLLELGAKLRRKRLVVRQDKRRAVDFLDDLCHRIRLARAGYAQERLLGEAVLEPCGKCVNGLGLVARGRIVADDFKVRHCFSFVGMDFAESRFSTQ